MKCYCFKYINKLGNSLSIHDSIVVLKKGCYYTAKLIPFFGLITNKECKGSYTVENFRNFYILFYWHEIYGTSFLAYFSTVPLPPVATHTTQSWAIVIQGYIDWHLLYNMWLSFFKQSILMSFQLIIYDISTIFSCHS